MKGFERKGNNLYSKEGKYYRLFGKGITPNECWVIAPMFRELLNINAASGEDVYGDGVIELEDVPACLPFIRYARAKTLNLKINLI